MKKRVLFSACVLAACLGACTNDDFITEKNQGIVESNGAETVIGADLVSEGLNIRINEGATTRVTDKGDWQVGVDKVGMGWYNYGSRPTTIYAEQTKEDWWSKAAKGTDSKLWANHIFSAVNNEGEGVWATTTNVYQGAYFVYFPYGDIDAITEKKLLLNSVPQKGEFQQDWMNNGLMLSAQDFIMKGEDVDPATKTLTKTFIIAPMVNALKMEMDSKEIQDAPEGDASYLKGMNITSVQLNAGEGNEVFAQAGQNLVISGIPTVQTAVEGQMPNDVYPIDNEKTREKLYEAAANATDGKSFLGKSPKLESTLTTEVQYAGYTLAENRLVRAFALPIPDKGADYTGAVENPTVTVNVGRLNEDGTTKYVLGTFNVNVENNLNFITKLKSALEGSDATLNKVLIDNDGNWGYLDLTNEKNELAAKLLLGSFNPITTKIETIEQWNDLVSVYDALHALEVNIADPTFIWDPKDDTQVFNGEIKTTKEGNITLATATGKKMVITGETTWPENLVTTKDVNAEIEVAAGATLSVGELDESAEVGDKVVEIEAYIDNNGIIKAGKNASIGTQEEDGLEGLDNTLEADGKNRVIVTYGAYVYPQAGKDGVIAYEVQPGEEELVSKEEVSKIEVLVGTEEKNVEWAYVNTLIVPEGIQLDLNAEGTSGTTSDRYEGTDSYSYEMPDLSKVDIELTGGSVVKTLPGDLTNVKNVYAISGESDIEDIQPLENIVVKGGTLNINTKPYPHSKDLNMLNDKNIEVKGASCYLNVNTNVKATYLINRAYGTIKINDANHITLPNVDNFTSETGSTLVGELEYETPAEEYTTEEQAVIDAFEAYKASTDAPTSLADMVEKINKKGDALLLNKGKWTSSDLYFALSDWMEVTVGIGLNESGTPTTLSETMFINFQNNSGYTFFPEQ